MDGSFFEPLEPLPPIGQSAPREPWTGPPRGVLPGLVALQVVLARTDRFVVAVGRLAGYPDGFELDLVTMQAPGDEGSDVDPMMWHPLRRRPGGAGEDQLLRFGIQFADGSKVTNHPGRPRRPEDSPSAPTMSQRSGHGGDGVWQQTQWVWPLPPPGSLWFVCEWPFAGIPLTRVEFDSQLLRDAAARAQVIFPDAGRGSGRTISTVSTGIAHMRRQEPPSGAPNP